MTLRSGSADDIRAMFNQLGGERKRLIDSIIQLVYFMRGSVQYDDMFDMVLVEREAIGEFIEKRLESERSKPNPQY